MNHIGVTHTSLVIFRFTFESHSLRNSSNKNNMLKALMQAHEKGKAGSTYQGLEKNYTLRKREQERQGQRRESNVL